MPDDDEAPQTFREVGIFLKYLKEDIREIKDGQKRVANLVFTALIAPIIVGIIVGYVMLNAR